MAGTGNYVGDIYIQAKNVSLEGIPNQDISKKTGIFTVIQQGGALSNLEGEGTGSITLNTDKLIIKDNAALSADTYGQGNAGNVTVNAKQIDLSNEGQIISVVREKARGNGGKIMVNTDNFTAVNKGLISSAVMAGGKGDGGIIDIKTSSLYLGDGARIESSLAGKGNKVGNISIEATDTALLQGIPGLPDTEDTANKQTGIFTLVSKDGQLLSSDGKGSISLTTNQLNINNDARLSTDTYGIGNAGNVIINTKIGAISLQQEGRIASRVADEGKGNGGNINISTGSLFLGDKGIITASTGGTGNAGNVTINATENVQLQQQGLVSSAVTDKGLGNAGNIKITTPQISLSSRSKIEVDSQTNDLNSSAGNITFLGNNYLKLDNASISATNSSGNGGNININTQNLLLRRNSEISTTAGSANNPGNGGKITINAKNGYVVAVPTEDSDIIANAFGGNGGKIDISAIRVLGLETRGRLNTAQLQTIRTNETSDITASSDVGTDGTVAIQSLGIDPSQGLVAIPVNLIDPSGLIAQDCNSNNSNSAQSQSEFVITGRGGLPPSPDDVLTAGALPAKWVTRGKGDRAILPIGIIPTTAPLIEAQGMVRNANGDIVLIAQPVIYTNFRSGLSSQLCRITQNQHKL